MKQAGALGDAQLIAPQTQVEQRLSLFAIELIQALTQQSEAGLVGFGTLFFCRIGREERLMQEAFGDAYRNYASRTSRILPGIF